MKTNWLISAGFKPHKKIKIDELKAIAPTWGSWKTWRDWSTDNVICHDKTQAKTLLTRAFQAVCNFYIPATAYADLGRPMGVKMYDGSPIKELNDVEDIIGMHLLASQCDIVLLLGFDFSTRLVPEDAVEKHRMINYLGMARSIMANSKSVQWVAIDHEVALDPAFACLENLSCDTMKSVIKLLGT